MARLTALHPDAATGKTKELYAAITGNLGMVPNLMRTMGNAPALLEGYLNLSGALAKGALGAKTAGLIALTVAEDNGCNYCLSAHSYIGANMLHLDEAAMQAARAGEADDAKTSAILKFAQALVRQKGQVSEAEVAAVKAAGATEGEVGEIVGHVALNILTNYLNIAADTEIDFPVVKAHATVSA